MDWWKTPEQTRRFARRRLLLLVFLPLIAFALTVFFPFVAWVVMVGALILVFVVLVGALLALSA